MLILHIVCIPDSGEVPLKENLQMWVWTMQGPFNVNKAVGYENPIKCCSLSIGTHEHDSEYTWIVLYLHAASCEGSAESFRMKSWRRIVSCKRLCQRLDFGSFCGLCMHTLFCSKIGLHSKYNTGKFFIEVGDVNGR